MAGETGKTTTTNTGSPVGRTSGDRRRSSGMFANLQQAKRDPSGAGVGRRASAAEHNAAPGMLGNLWNKTFKS